MRHWVYPVHSNRQRHAVVVALALAVGLLASCSSQLTSSGPTSSGSRSSVSLGTLAAEFPLGTTAGPDAIAAGPDGNLWFTEQDGGSIGRISSTTGTITPFALATNSRAMGIAAGPDGNLWFTEVDLSNSNTIVGAHIGRISPTTGTITEFPLPPVASLPVSTNQAMGIAAGPDGNLWFTEPFRSKVGRITPTGTIAEFHCSGDPSDIAAGPDGSLWFTFAGGIGRITPTGTTTEFAVSLYGRPHDITAGPDGNLWYLDDTHIERISPSDPINPPPATITEFTPAPINGIPIEYSAPEHLTAGPDGNLWFTQFGRPDDTNPVGGRIGRIRPTTGTIAESELAPDIHPRGITVGPDGNLWITEPAGNRIGRFTPAVGTSG
jgi:streptogramin lyase